MKVLGTVLLILGSILTLWCGAAFIDYLATTKEKVIARYEQHGFARGMHVNPASYDNINGQLIAARCVTGIFTLLGVGMAYGGYRLRNRKP